MTVQCVATTCIAIDDTLGVIAADHEGQLFLTSPTGDRPIARLSRQSILPAIYGGTGPQATGELLTITQDGRAMLTIHRSDSPAMILTAFGTCTSL